MSVFSLLTTLISPPFLPCSSFPFLSFLQVAANLLGWLFHCLCTLKGDDKIYEEANNAQGGNAYTRRVGPTASNYLRIPNLRVLVDEDR